MMQKVISQERSEEKIVISALCDRIEYVLSEGDKKGARELIPKLRILCRRIKRFQRLSGNLPALSQNGGDLLKIGLSRYVIAVAALAGRKEEFAEYA